MTQPKGVRDIFAVQPYLFTKPPAITKIIKSLLGNGMIVVEGDAHRSQKKAMQSALKVRQIMDLYPVFERKTAELITIVTRALETKANGGDCAFLDLGTYLHQVTLDIIGIAGFGLDFNCLTDSGNKLATDYARGFTPSKDAQKYRMLALVMPEWLLDRLPLKRNRELRAAVLAVRESTGDMIEQRVADLDCQNESTHDVHKDVIGSLMTEGGVRDKEILINQSMTILGAGHDTVHFAIESAIWEMCRNPKMQHRLRAEVRQFTKSPVAAFDRKTNILNIDSLRYLQAVCNETLRLHHSVPTMYRQNIEPVMVGGQYFPRGTPFVIPIGAFNRCSKLWKSDPSCFDPERWLEDPVLGGAENRNALLTFSAGARICVGERFARAELKHLLAGLVGSFNFTWAGTGKDRKSQGMQLEHGITSRMIGGLWVQMEVLPE